MLMQNPRGPLLLMLCVIFTAALSCDRLTQQGQAAALPPAAAVPLAAAALPASSAVPPPPLVLPPLQAPDLASLAAQVLPAVVSIQVEQVVRAPNVDPFGLFEFYGQAPPRDYANKGIGSGFLIDANGLILTNQHVIDKADSIVVRLSQPDGSEQRLAARVVGTAPDYDVALLRTDRPPAKNPQPLALGDSGAMRIGDWVMAVGNPFGLDHSVSVGIVSAKDRRDVAPSGRHGFYDFIQTDASINPGNSGGPLINLRGEAIAINAAINAQGQGIGFAIPINMVKEMLPQLKAHGTFVRSYLGVQVQAMSEELAQSFGLEAARGVLVADVQPDGPAAAAGLQAGDVVLAFGGRTLHHVHDLQLFASMAEAGKEVELSLWRGGKPLQVRVKLAALKAPPPPPTQADGREAVEPTTTAHMGLIVADLTPHLRQQLGLPGRPGGALIQRVLPGGIAQAAGLQRFDVIEEVGDTAVVDAAWFAQRVSRAQAGEALRLQVRRQGGRLFVILKKPQG